MATASLESLDLVADYESLGGARITKPGYTLGIYTGPTSNNNARSRLSSFLRVFFADLRAILVIPINLFKLIIEWLQWFWIVITAPSGLYIPYVGIGIPRILFILLFILLLYTWSIFWPIILRFVVVTLTPLVNIGIILFNFWFNLTILVLRILFQIWNMLVPFIGMILYFLIDLLVTILQAVFDIIGSEAFMGIIQATLEIIFLIVDIAMQIWMVWLQVSMSNIQAFSEISGFMMEIIMAYVTILMDVLVWIVDLLFKILEPILFVVEALAASFAWMSSLKGFSRRKLLAVGMSGLAISSGMLGGSDNPNQEYEQFVQDKIPLGNTDVRDTYDQWRMMVKTGNVSRIHTDNFHYSEVENNPYTTEEYIMNDARQRMHQPTDSTTRKLFQHGTSNDGGDKFDETTHIFMHHFHRGVNEMVRDGGTSDIQLMQESMARIRAQRRRKDRISSQSILRKFRLQHPDLARLKPGPASVRFHKKPEHPRDMHMRFHDERKEYAERHGLPASVAWSGQQRRGTARALLENWDDPSSARHIDHLSRLEKDHAKQIVEQEKQYVTHHLDHIKLAHVIHNSARMSILKHAQTTFRYDNIFTHWDRIIKRAGWQSPWDAFHEFLDTHGDAAAFVASISRINEHPLIKFWTDRDPDYDKDTPLFHDWYQQELALMKKNVRHKHGVGRRLLQSSEVNLEGFEVISTSDCYSSPRNPLCMPEIPPDFEWSMPLIVWPSNITENDDCPPWRHATCLVCVDRFHNAFQSFRFMITGFPPFNYALTTFTILVPWMAWLVDWLFIIDKGETATLFEVICFIIHLYDLLITWLTVWFFLYFIYPLIKVFIILPLAAFRTTAQIRWDTSGVDGSEAGMEDIWRSMTAVSRRRLHRFEDWRPDILQHDPNSFMHTYGFGRHPEVIKAFERQREGPYTTGRIGSRLGPQEHTMPYLTSLVHEYTTSDRGDEEALLARLLDLLRYLHHNGLDLSGDWDQGHIHSVRRELTFHPIVEHVEEEEDEDEEDDDDEEEEEAHDFEV